MAQERKKTVKRMMIDSDDEEEEEVINLENPEPSDTTGSGGVKRKTEGESGMEKPEKKRATNNPYPWEMSKPAEDDAMYIGYRQLDPLEGFDVMEAALNQCIGASLDRDDVTEMLDFAGIRKSNIVVKFKWIASRDVINEAANPIARINRHQRIDVWLVNAAWSPWATPPVTLHDRIVHFMKTGTETPVFGLETAGFKFETKKEYPRAEKWRLAREEFQTRAIAKQSPTYRNNTLYKFPDRFVQHSQKVAFDLEIDISLLVKPEDRYQWWKYLDMDLLASTYLKTASTVWDGISDAKEQVPQVILDYREGKRMRTVIDVKVDPFQALSLDDDGDWFDDLDGIDKEAAAGTTTKRTVFVAGVVVYAMKLDDARAIQSNAGKQFLEMHPLIKRMLFAKHLYTMSDPIAIRDATAYRQLSGFISSKYRQ